MKVYNKRCDALNKLAMYIITLLHKLHSHIFSEMKIGMRTIQVSHVVWYLVAIYVAK